MIIEKFGPLYESEYTYMVRDKNSYFDAQRALRLPRERVRCTTEKCRGFEEFVNKLFELKPKFESARDEGGYLGGIYANVVDSDGGKWQLFYSSNDGVRKWYFPEGFCDRIRREMKVTEVAAKGCV